MNKTKIDNEDPVLYTVKDIQRIFHCGQRQAYCLVNSAGFPMIRLNHKILVSKPKLEAWINTYTGKEFKYRDVY